MHIKTLAFIALCALLALISIPALAQTTEFAAATKSLDVPVPSSPTTATDSTIVDSSSESANHSEFSCEPETGYDCNKKGGGKGGGKGKGKGPENKTLEEEQSQAVSGANTLLLVNVPYLASLGGVVFALVGYFGV